MFDDMIADIMTNKKFQAIIKKLFISSRKLNIALVFITESYFLVPKDVRLNSTYYLIMKINSKRELQNIAINHSADIDYNDSIKIYRECTRKLSIFLRMILRYQQVILEDLEKVCLILYKNDSNWSEQNFRQNNYAKKSTKISALSSNNLDKYEYLTGVDLGYKPSVTEEAKFEHSPLRKIFNKGQDEDDDKKEGLLKRLKNIEDENEERLTLFSRVNKTSGLARNESDYNYDNDKFSFYRFYRDFQNFKNGSLDSKYSDMSKFYRALKEFKECKVITTETKEGKTRVMNNVVTRYNNYFNSYEKTFDESALHEKEGYDPNQFKIVGNGLPEFLESKNDFKEEKRLIDNININMNKDKVSKKDKKVVNDLNKFITDISNNKTKEKDATKGLEKSIFELSQLTQKEKTVFQNKMIQVVYQLFNSFGFNKEFAPLLLCKKESEQTEENIQKPLWFKINKPEFDELTGDIYNNQDNKDLIITINKKNYDLKNEKKKIWTEVTTCKISKWGKNCTKNWYKKTCKMH